MSAQIGLNVGRIGITRRIRVGKPTKGTGRMRVRPRIRKFGTKATVNEPSAKGVAVVKIVRNHLDFGGKEQ